jgi:hypothetical protein
MKQIETPAAVQLFNATCLAFVDVRHVGEVYPLTSRWTTKGSEFGSQKYVHVIQTDPGTHPASSAMHTGGAHSPEIRRPGRETDHSPLTSA